MQSDHAHEHPARHHCHALPYDFTLLTAINSSMVYPQFFF
jgi:hypothetical protein